MGYETYEEACEAADALGEVYADTLTQYRSEMAGFGDAWPGAAIQLREMKEALDEAEAAVKRLAPPKPPVVDAPHPDDLDDDIPF